jgi:hypothetical protein
MKSVVIKVAENTIARRANSFMLGSSYRSIWFSTLCATFVFSVTLW